MSDISVTAVQFAAGFLAFAAGALVFSFLNTVIYRLPEKKLFGRGRQLCKTCGHELLIKDMVPVLSWLWLRGRCRYCGNSIKKRYPFVEAMGGIIAVLLTFNYGFTLRTLTVFLFFSVLTVITFIDIDTMTIPPVLNVMVFVIGVISVFTLGNAGLVDRIIGMFAISLPMLIVTLIVPGGFGGGDIKLMFAAGFLLGWKSTVAAFVIGLFLGGFYGIYLLIGRKGGRKTHFAFGPFLCIGMAIAFFAGDYMINLYIGYFFGVFAN